MDQADFISSLYTEASPVSEQPFQPLCYIFIYISSNPTGQVAYVHFQNSYLELVQIGAEI